MKRSIASALILACALTVAQCHVNIRDVLDRALGLIALDHDTSIDYSKLSGGICYKDEDGGPRSGCLDIPEGASVGSAPSCAKA